MAEAADQPVGDQASGPESQPDPHVAQSAVPVHRMFSIVDAVVAIAMTILLLDIRIPAGLDDEPLRQALRGLVPDLWSFALSVVVIAWFWRSHHLVMRHATRIDAPLVWLNFMFLALVSLIPFPTSVLEDYPRDIVGPVLYAVDIAGAALVQALIWVHLARRDGTLKEAAADITRVRPFVMSVIVASVFLVSIPVAVRASEWAIEVWIGVPVLSLIALVVLRRAADRQGE
jgi:uncharacterized membrane protein